MKATEQYFPLVLFIMLYKVVSTFKCGCNSIAYRFCPLLLFHFTLLR